MNDLIRIRATKEGVQPAATLENRELGYYTDEKALYIGVNRQNIKLCQADDVGRVATKVEALSDDADILQVVAKVNEIISALQDSGLMNK